MYIIKQFKYNGQNYYLIPNDWQSKSRLLELLTRKQARKNEFLNVQYKPYTGRKYNNVVYIVEG